VLGRSAVLLHKKPRNPQRSIFGADCRGMRKKRTKAWIVWLLGIVAALVFGGAPPAAASRKEALHWVDVGQGASLVAVGSDAVIVIDSGPAGASEAILRALGEHGITRVDLWIHTHFDADHIGGVVRAVAGLDGIEGTGDDLEIDILWDRGLESAPTTAVMADYLERFGDRRRAVDTGERWQVPGLGVEVVSIGGGADENARGLALRLEVGALSTLVLGDLPASEAVVAAQRAGTVDILWASHHGARNGFDPRLLDLADPDAVVISAGHKNSYCHPAPEVLAWLAGREVWITGAAGIAPSGPCKGLAASLSVGHQVLGGDLVLAVDP